MIRRLVMTGIVLGCLAAPAWGQTVIAVDLQKANLSWDWAQGTGSAATEFRVYCQPVGGPPAAPTILTDPTVRTVPLRSVVTALGQYTCAVTAANEFGESARSNEVAFRAGTVPPAPTNLRILAQ